VQISACDSKSHSLLGVRVSDISRHFTVLNVVIRHNRRFNSEGRELTVSMTDPPTDSVASRDIARYFAESVDELFEYALRNL
jgi:hypothetical protein